MTKYGLARVSSEEQAIDSHALRQQVQRLVDAGAQIVIEEVVSGSSSKRVKFKELQALIEAGEVTEVIATRIDRISRSLTALRKFVEICEKNRVNLRILDQQIDLSTPHGKLMLNMLGSVAEWEIDLLRSRVEAGLKHHRSEGRAPGIIPFGYKRENDRYAPNLDRYRDSDKTIWQVAREIIDTFLSVQTVRGTARIMGEKYGPRTNEKGGSGFEDFPRANGLRYWLKSPVLDGDTAYYYRSGKKVDKPIDLRKGTHESLISHFERAEIDRILAIPRQGTRNFDDPLPLAGLLVCSKCGRKMRAFRHKKKKRVIVRWYCSGQHSAPKLCEGVEGHRNEDITGYVIQVLTSYDSASEIAEDASNECDPIQDTPEIKQLVITLTQLDLMEQNPALEDAKKSIRQQIQNKRLEISQQGEVKASLKDDLLQIGNDPGFWWTREKPEQRRLFRQYIDHVVCSKDGYEVKLRF